ncbi:MAG: Mrp/NBP35 family ATP-binding protein [Firmicutes bacterium]|jgi:ATP-binding protein involved in chromosome partitioning|nr:Mrp/NBP35 family ATP-binding protein [Bacillota bacterium]
MDDLYVAVGSIIDSLTKLDLLTLGCVDQSSKGDTLTIKLPVEPYPHLDELLQEIKRAVTSYGEDLKIDTAEMTEGEIERFAAALRSNNTVLSSSGTGKKSTQAIAVSSGKGGVGKSSVTVNLALALAALGKSVAVLDADIYGFSIPSMLGITESPIVVGNIVITPFAYGVRCISMGFFVEEDVAIAWRGPMLHKTLEQFVTEVYFGDLDYLLIDMPPGTGDVALSISQSVPGLETVIVTTPQLSAQKVAQRAGALANQLDIPIRGVVENMSYFRGDDEKRYDIFGSGGGRALAEKFGVDLLAEIPIVAAEEMGLDKGTPLVAVRPESEVGRIYFSLAEALIKMQPRKIYKSGLRIK